MPAAAIHSLSVLLSLVFSPCLLRLSFFFFRGEKLAGWNNLKSLLHCAEEMIVLCYTPSFLLTVSELEFCCLIISGPYLCGHQLSKHILLNYEKFTSCFLCFYVVLLYCFLIKFWSWTQGFYNTISKDKKITKIKIGENIKERGIKLDNLI